MESKLEWEVLLIISSTIEENNHVQGSNPLNVYKFHKVKFYVSYFDFECISNRFSCSFHKYPAVKLWNWPIYFHLKLESV